MMRKIKRKNDKFKLLIKNKGLEKMNVATENLAENKIPSKIKQNISPPNQDSSQTTQSSILNEADFLRNLELNATNDSNGTLR